MSPVALITGASRGLGLALARELAARGWSLLITARGAEALEAARAELAALTHVIALSGDVADPAHHAELAHAAAQLGGINALVHNASILGPSPRPDLLDFPTEALENVFRVNTFAPLALTQAIWPHLAPDGRVVAISSDAGVEAYAGWGGYGASKAALEHLFAILAAEHPDRRIYWVDPGDMNTQMHQEAFPGEDISDRPQPGESVPGLVALLANDMPSGRYRSREIGQAASGVRELRVALTVDNLDAAQHLFNQELGMPLVLSWDQPEGRGRILHAPRATLELIDQTQAATIDRIEAGARVSGQVRLALEVADVAEATAVVQRAGIQPIRANVQTPWGDRNTRLSTEGMQITLFQAETEQEVAT